MICVHLKELYSLCEQHELRLGGSDLIHVVCKQCQQQDTCPSNLMDDDDSIGPEAASQANSNTTAPTG